MLDFLRKVVNREEEEAEEPLAPGIITIASPDLVQPDVVPAHIIERMWSVIEKDAALTFLDDREIKWLQYKVEVIAEIASIIIPEVYHPDLLRLLHRGLKEWLDEENAKLLAYLRLKRSWRGMERRLQTIQAPRLAARGGW